MIIRMSKFGFRRVYIVLLSLTLVFNLFSQEDMTRYEKHMDKYQRAWNRLIPRYGKIQYAGMMGFLSFGTGWDYGKNRQWETDLSLGLLPKFSSRDFKVTMTLKQSFIPWQHQFSDRWRLDPLSCGIFITTIFNEEFWTDQPSKYPSGYYPIPTKLRLNAYVGQRIVYVVPEERRFFARKITFFYELGMNDIYFLNKT